MNSDMVAIIAILIGVILFAGEPNLMDAIISHVEKK